MEEVVEVVVEEEEEVEVEKEEKVVEMEEVGLRFCRCHTQPATT